MPIAHQLRLRPNGTQIVNCPRCTAQIRLSRSPDPHIDSAGFESYTLACVECEIVFSGIIDPYDDAFLTEEADWDIKA